LLNLGLGSGSVLVPSSIIAIKTLVVCNTAEVGVAGSGSSMVRTLDSGSKFMGLTPAFYNLFCFYSKFFIDTTYTLNYVA